ncbi:MAG: hypothetical protein ACRDP3_24005 [Streptomyces sp.]|uniref:hypothetical protein n=1 Tax=Streptomyces sp. TaxID=1931 RepID=UPI003D6C48BA
MGAEEERETTEGHDRTEQRWQKGCLVALLVLSSLVVLGLLGLAELEKSLDGYGQLEQGPDDSSGSAADPLAPGATAEYEDGLTVTVSEPHREPGGRAHRFTLTYENGTDETLKLALDSGYGGDPLDVRAGESLDDDGPEDGSTSDWLNQEQAARKLSPPLGEDDSVTVPVRVAGDTKGMPITVEVTPPDDGYRDTAYWQLTLD